VLTIAHAADFFSKWRQEMTSVTARSKSSGQTATGYSGNGRAVGDLLRKSNNPDAKKLSNALAGLQRIQGETRTGFSCAEPHAVAQLVSWGYRLGDIVIDLAIDLGGKKAECPVCSQWIYNGSIALPEELYRSPETPSYLTGSAKRPVPKVEQSLPLRGTKEFDEQFPALPGPGRGANHY
jgi:hypothetical protein